MKGGKAELKYVSVQLSNFNTKKSLSTFDDQGLPTYGSLWKSMMSSASRWLVLILHTAKGMGPFRIQIHIKEYSKELHENPRGLLCLEFIFDWDMRLWKESVFFKQDMVKGFNKTKVHDHIYVQIFNKKDREAYGNTSRKRHKPRKHLKCVSNAWMKT